MYDGDWSTYTGSMRNSDCTGGYWTVGGYSRIYEEAMWWAIARSNSNITVINNTPSSDYGGICGLCTDGILNNIESESNYYGSGYDHGGKWCGSCRDEPGKDGIWLAAVKLNGLDVPFDTKLCKDVEGVISFIGIFLIILIILALLLLFGFFLMLSIPLILSVSRVVIAVMMWLRRKRKSFGSDEDQSKLKQYLRSKKRKI